MSPAQTNPENSSFGESKLLAEPSLRQFVESTIGSIENASVFGDGHLSFPTQNKSHDGVGILTNDYFWLFRKKGILGPKQPLSVPLKQVTEVGISSDSVLSIKFTESNGMPRWWMFAVYSRTEESANEWLAEIDRARLDSLA